MKRPFCVIVPAYNEEVVIEGTLKRLIEAGARPSDIYLVDDCSQDATGEIARSLGVHVLRNDPNIGKALGVLRVVREFKLTEFYDYISLMDSDTMVDHGYYNEMIKEFERPILTQHHYKELVSDFLTMDHSSRELSAFLKRKAPMLEHASRLLPQGIAEHVLRTHWRKELFKFLKLDTTTLDDISPLLPEGVRGKYQVVIACGRPIPQLYNWLTEYRALCYANGHYVYRSAQTKFGVVAISPGCSTMFRASTFNRLKWDNPTKAEDMYVTIQVHHEHIGRVVYVGNARVYTQTPRTLTGHIKQRLRWDGGTWQVIKAHRVYFGMRAIDWECKFLWTEGLLISVLRMCMPFILIWASVTTQEMTGIPWYFGLPLAIGGLYVGSYLVSLPTMLIFTILMKRWTILKYSPLYMILRDIDHFVFVYAFVLVIILNKDVKWYSPPRYKRNEKRKHAWPFASFFSRLRFWAGRVPPPPETPT